MSDEDAGVDDVGAGSCTGGVVVVVCCGAGRVAGQTGQAPGGVGLCDDGLDGDDGVLFDVVDL